jgi:DNA-binding NarL/FixJ family response regulator
VIRVLVADDHAVVRSGLEELLRGPDDIDFVGAYSDGESTIEAALAQRPDVVLMDLQMPGVDGIQATSRLRELLPAVQIVVLTSFSDRDRILAALEAGAVGYLLKDAEPEELLAGIRAAARGGSPIAPKAARELVEAHVGRGDEPQLSARALVAAGLPNKLIGQRLGIAEKTVKVHLTTVYRTIGVHDRVQAALWARERGLTLS